MDPNPYESPQHPTERAKTDSWTWKELGIATLIAISVYGLVGLLVLVVELSG